MLKTGPDTAIDLVWFYRPTVSYTNKYCSSTQNDGSVMHMPLSSAMPLCVPSLVSVLYYLHLACTCANVNLIFCTRACQLIQDSTHTNQTLFYYYTQCNFVTKCWTEPYPMPNKQELMSIYLQYAYGTVTVE